MRPDPETDHKHSLNPKPGDYWNECFMPVCVVLQVGSHHVYACETTKDAGDNHWTWDLEAAPVVYTREDFANRWRYGRVGNSEFAYTDDLAEINNRCWCNVAPESHKTFSDAWESTPPQAIGG